MQHMHRTGMAFYFVKRYSAEYLLPGRESYEPFCRPKKTQRRLMPWVSRVRLTTFSGSLSSVETFCWTSSCSASKSAS